MFTNNEVVVITGATGGIGEAIAKDFAKKGATTVLTYYRNSEKMASLIEEITELGGKSFGYKLNVADEAEVKHFFRKIKKEVGEVDVLVNNSGITKDGFLPIMSSSKFNDVIDTNLLGTFYCSREVIKQMMKNKKGSIVNIASTSGISGAKGQTNYSASKGGIISFTKSLALESAEYNIRANVVAPGFIETNMTKEMNQDVLNSMLELIPLKRLGKPEEVANVTTFLASDNASYITGKTITIDGGLING